MDEWLCGTPFEQQAVEDQERLEEMVDGMGLRAVLLILQRIAYAKAEHIEDHRMATERRMTGNRLGEWATSINHY
jgi:hypothetical protein